MFLSVSAGVSVSRRRNNRRGGGGAGGAMARWVTEFSGDGDLYKRHDDVLFQGRLFTAALPAASATTFSVQRCSML